MKSQSNYISSEELNNGIFTKKYRGMYSSTQFSIRLREDVRKLVFDSEENTPERFQAFSTYLHETIHWWQHVGSNFGFFISLSLPSFVMNSYQPILNLKNQGIAKKPIIKLRNDEMHIHNDDLNIITNNYYDIEYARLFSLDNRYISNIIEDKQFFIGIGHCYRVMRDMNLIMVAEVIDKKFTFIPQITNPTEFEKLNKNKIEGFYPDSDYSISPLGIKAIFEGQAVFNQIEYLSIVFRDNKIIFKDFIDNGTLYGIYIEAFDLFLDILEEERPFFVNDPLISLFLLICDLSINGNNGFPLNIYDYEKFVKLNDPGYRFVKMCQAATTNKDYILTKVEHKTKGSYVELSKYLNKKIGSKCSYQSLKEIKSWQKEASIKELLKEEELSEFKDQNLPFRLLLSKYINFQLDKLESPEVFCWIGHYLSKGESPNPMKLFEKNSALFIEANDGELKQIVHGEKDTEKLYKTFNRFFQHNILYDLIIQWISKPEEFNLNFDWLLNKRNSENIPFMKKDFEAAFNINIDDIELYEE